MAVCAPILGRLIDRHGARRLLEVTGFSQPLALGAVVASAKLALPFPLIVASALVAGALAPPITTLTRTMWRHRFERDEDRRMAFALDAVTIEINFTIGPALMAAILAAVGATFAFCTAIVAIVAAVTIFAFSPAVAYFQKGEARERHLLGPLTEPRLWALFAATFGLALGIGQLEVGYPAYATALGIPALGGVLLGVNSLGSALGGAIYGGMRYKASVERQFATAMGLMVLPLFLHAVVEPLGLFAAVAFVAGALIAPSIAAQSVLVSRLAPAHYATEAFTWSSTFILTGLGSGMALGGQLVETIGVRAPYVVGACVVAAMSLLALATSAVPQVATARGNG
jgi:predicted MFS family arabinose efflux permease